LFLQQQQQQLQQQFQNIILLQPTASQTTALILQSQVRRSLSYVAMLSQKRSIFAENRKVVS
jgi:hypothetical protein